MRTVAVSTLFLLWPCANAMAAKNDTRNPPPPASVQVKNDTPLRVQVVAVARADRMAFYDQTLEPADKKTIEMPRGTTEFVLAVSAQVGPFRAFESRRYSVSEGCFRIAITVTESTRFHLSDPLPCDADEPPQDPPPPQASVRTREALLAALSSSGLCFLALVGLLINRHQ